MVLLAALLEIGINLELQFRMVSAVDRLLKSTPQTEEFLWILWELRDVSRSDCGREALLTLVVFPVALAVLIEALHSVKDMEPAVGNSGNSAASFLNLLSWRTLLGILLQNLLLAFFLNKND